MQVCEEALKVLRVSILLKFLRTLNFEDFLLSFINSFVYFLIPMMSLTFSCYNLND